MSEFVGIANVDRTRSRSAPFSDAGSTMGNDAGINLLHNLALASGKS
ncbi:MAG: hypothetical protein WCA20_20340 [Candidatus Sulfotelmatobacter sp.]